MMRSVVFGLLLLLLIIPAGRAQDEAADQLTDAIVPSDPRDRLQTGVGAALGDIYSPDPEPAAPIPAGEAAPSPYRAPYDGLRSPLYGNEGNQGSDDLWDDPRSATVPLVPPGQLYDREGVWVQDQPAPLADPYDDD